MLKTPEIRDRHCFPQSVRACTTAATIRASTGPRIRNRAPVLNSTSITPGDSGNLVLVAASVGTSNVNDANRAAPCNCRRQRNSWLACIPASRATADATAPGSIAAATMRSFSALDHLRRCRSEVTISTCVFVIGSPPNPLSDRAVISESLRVHTCSREPLLARSCRKAVILALHLLAISQNFLRRYTAPQHQFDGHHDNPKIKQ